MTTEFAVVPEGGEVPAGAIIVVHSENGLISAVTRPSDAESGATGAGSAGRALRYVLVSRQATPLAAVSAL